MERMKGEAKMLLGKIEGKQAKVEEGRRMKAGEIAWTSRLSHILLLSEIAVYCMIYYCYLYLVLYDILAVYEPICNYNPLNRLLRGNNSCLEDLKEVDASIVRAPLGLSTGMSLATDRQSQSLAKRLRTKLWFLSICMVV